MTNRPTYASSLLAFVAPTLAVVPACTTSGPAPNLDHCTVHVPGGNRFCVARHGDALPYCTRSVATHCGATMFADGCVASQPSDDSCYYPCGPQSLAESPDPQCDQFPPTVGGTMSGGEGTTGSTSDSGTSWITEGTAAGEDDRGESAGLLGESSVGVASEGSSSDDDVYGCFADDECGTPEAPACDRATGACVPCSAAENPNAVCEALDSGTPVCFEDRCVSCTDEDPGACAGLTPICVENTCVACTAELLGACAGTTPRCDPETRACIGCTAHDQCPVAAPMEEGAACDLESGACFPEDAVWHVDADDPRCDDSGDGIPPFPLCTLQAALDRISDRGTVICHNSNPDNEDVAYPHVAVIEGPKTVAILGAVAERPVTLRGPGGATVLAVRGDALVYLEGLEIESESIYGAVGLEIEASRVVARDLEIHGNWGVGLWLSNASFSGREIFVVRNQAIGIRLDGTSSFRGQDVDVGFNSGTGVVVAGGSLFEAERSRFYSNYGPELQVLGLAETEDPRASLRIVNSFVAESSDAGGPTISVEHGLAEFLYTSVVGSADAASVRCSGAVSVVLRNALVANEGPVALECPTAEVVTSYVAAQAEDLSAWFADPAFGNGDLKLAVPPGAVLETGRWRAGDPATDIDGQLRPTQADATDVVGADIPDTILGD